MRLHLIVARASNGVIGAGGKIPWHLSADLRRFKAITTGHPILMGRKTWESIGRPLPGRTNIIITRDDRYQANGAIVTHSLEAAVRAAAEAGAPEAFVIGGGDIYRAALPHCEVAHITEVDLDVEGDATFPDLVLAEWRETSRETHAADATSGGPAFAFVTYERVRPSQA